MCLMVVEGMKGASVRCWRESSCFHIFLMRHWVERIPWEGEFIIEMDLGQTSYPLVEVKVVGILLGFC